MDSDLESRAPSPSSDIALSSNNIDPFLEDITVDIADENESSLMSENKLKNRLFNTLKTIKPILDFLEVIEIGRRPKKIKKENTANK